MILFLLEKLIATTITYSIAMLGQLGLFDQYFTSEVLMYGAELERYTNHSLAKYSHRLPVEN